jgi:hypothetical protein
VIAPQIPRFWPLFAIALGVRFVVVILGSLLATLPPDPYQDPQTPRQFRAEMLAGSVRVIEPWYRFDAEWYVRVARQGYAKAEDAGGRVGVAFLPALPAVLAAADWLGIDIFWAGILSVNLAAAAGTTILARVAAKLTGDRATAIRAFVLINAFPTALFFSAPYNESFGLLFTALAMDAWIDRKSLRAGVFALFGSLARMTGVAVGVAAIASWLCDDRSRQGSKRALIVATASFAGLALFWLYLWWAVGDPFAGLKSQASWGRRQLSLWNPWYAIQSIYDPRLPRWSETYFVVLFALLGVRAWLRRGAFWGVLTLMPVAMMMMSGTFMSGHRLILAALPGFIELAELLRNRSLFRVTVVGFAVGQWILLHRYVHWVWAG